MTKIADIFNRLGLEETKINFKILQKNFSLEKEISKLSEEDRIDFLDYICDRIAENNEDLIEFFISVKQDSEKLGKPYEGYLNSPEKIDQFKKTNLELEVSQIMTWFDKLVKRSNKKAPELSS